MPDVSGALQLYARAVEYVGSAGLQQEVAWQRSTDVMSVNEPTFLREAAWVVLCSGFREAVVRRVFDNISLCFCDWESAHAIVDSYPYCYISAQAAFGNKSKLSAIVQIARIVDSLGFCSLKASLISDPISTLGRLPYIGPVTVWHLAKNLGINTQKPDRHLVRISRQFGFSDAEHFCATIAEANDEPIKVIDLVVWRYLADNGARAFA